MHDARFSRRGVSRRNHVTAVPGRGLALSSPGSLSDARRRARRRVDVDCRRVAERGLDRHCSSWAQRSGRCEASDGTSCRRRSVRNDQGTGLSARRGRRGERARSGSGSPGSGRPGAGVGWPGRPGSICCCSRAAPPRCRGWAWRAGPGSSRCVARSSRCLRRACRSRVSGMPAAASLPQRRRAWEREARSRCRRGCGGHRRTRRRPRAAVDVRGLGA